jgi:hypothetical protein
MIEPVYDRLLVSYELRFDDNKVLLRRPARIIIQVWSFFTILTIIIFVLSVVYGSQKINAYGIISLGIFLFFLLLFVLAYFRNPQRTWKQHEDLPKDRDITIMPDCIDVQSSYMNYECAWEWVTLVKEYKELYIIFHYNQRAIIIPKRVMTNGEEELFRKIVKFKLGRKKVRLKNRNGKARSIANEH